MRSKLLQNLIDLDPARLGEVNLLLYTLAEGGKSKDVARKGILSISGRSDRIPQPDLYFEIALGLGLINENGDNIELTTLGKELYVASSGPPYDRLKRDQIQILAPEILMHPELEEILIQALESMFPNEANGLQIMPGDISITEPAFIGLKILQVVGFAHYNNGVIVLTNESLRELRNILGETAPLGEDDFWQIQQEINNRAKKAEEYVLQFEHHRLIQAGCKELSRMVTRVSKYDVGAHYDIHSFEENAQPRYIEVKSSSGPHLNFIWSLAERRFAKLKGKAYWLYFVPRAQDLPDFRHGLILIRDPEGKCGTTLTTEPSSYRVTAQDDVVSISASMLAGEIIRVLE